MRKLYIVILILVGINVNGQRNMLEIKRFGANPGNLKMFLYIPPKLETQSIASPPSGHMPLVVALHGCTQNAKSLAEASGWNKLADTYGFYVLYPQQKTINNVSGCFNWFEDGDITKDKGEVFSIREMIEFVTDSLLIDTNRVFVYGLSAGAAMGVALMADYPYVFNMGAILAGGPFMPGQNPLQALSSMEDPKDISSKELSTYVLAQNPGYKGKYPRLLLIHGENDKVVNLENSYELIRQWAPLLNADSTPTKIITAFDGIPDIVRKSYRDSGGKEQIIFYEVSNLGHALMVAPGDSVDQGGKTGVFSVDKGFFSTYWIARDMGLIK
ncbi:MAG: alpha/beta hydrolase family esterase [Bacteroidia bacterium]